MTLPLRASFQGKREENSVRLLKLVSMLGSTTREASIPAGAQDGEALLLEVLLKVKALGNHQVRLFATPWTAAHAAEDRLLCPQNSPGKNTGVGCRALLQGIFPTQGLNPRILLAGRFFISRATCGTPSCIWGFPSGSASNLRAVQETEETQV